MMIGTMNVFERLISIVAPHNCLVCDAEGTLVCSNCASVLVCVSPPRCYRCYKLTTRSSTCKKCRKISSLSHVWITTQYTGVSKELIHVLKFERTRAATDVIVRAMLSSLPDEYQNAIVVPIPTATSRRRLRGYDQSVLIASGISKHLHLPMKQLLVRIGQSRQVGSSKADRLKQLEHAYKVIRKDKVQGSHIILVDDVMTTGGTLESAARTLKKAGASRVDAVVFARA